MGIAGPYGIVGGAGVARLRGGTGPGRASGFAVREDGVAGGVSGGSAVGLSSLLGVQEAGQDAARDQDAREHGESLLEGLAALQRVLLGGGGTEALERLAALVRRAPAAADPRLAAVQREVMVRAAVELARRRVATSV